jgi:poly-gamma-glutamate synthesis protein (capsule biosynthesis protein)
MLNQDRMRYKIFLSVILAFVLALFWHQKLNAPATGLPASDLPLAPESSKEFSIVAVGDISLARHIGEAIEKTSNPNLPFEKVHALLTSADITFGNLECPLSDSKIPIREGMTFRCLTQDVSGLSFVGFNVLATANNHAFDQGAKGLEFTIDYLKSQNILPVGTGKNLEEAWRPVLFSLPAPSGAEGIGGDREGVKFAFLAASYASANDNGKTRNDYVARIEDLPILQSAIKNLKSEDYIVIVMMHAGTEYTRHPNQEQINFAHAAIDAGADIVIGHHPHWVQPVEVYQGKPIFYSLGNFVFDQSWSEETKEGLAVRFQIKDSRLKSAELIPIIIENNCCPRAANETEKTAILKKNNLASDIINF